MDNQDNEAFIPSRTQPRNLLGLLRFAMEATKSEDAPHESHFSQMDPERRKFLKDVFKSMTIDVIEKLQDAVKSVMDPSSTSVDQLSSLDVISNFIDDLDTANDFHKIGGFCIIEPGLNSPHSAVRAKTASLIGDLAQNNPYCQKYLLELNIFSKLMEMMTETPDVSCDAMRAISCMVRHYEPCLAAFISIGGLECVIGCIENNESTKLQIKSAFLLSSICCESPPIVDELIRLNAIESITVVLREINEIELEDMDFMTKVEQLLRALSILAESKQAVQELRAPKLNFKRKLDNIKQTIGDREEYLEIGEFCENLLKICFDDTRNDTDR